MLDIRTILAPVDLSDETVPAVEEAVRLADRFDAVVVLLHVFGSLHGRIGLTCEEVEVASVLWLTPAQRRIAEECARLSRRVRVRFSVGPTAETIVQQAALERADLLVMQTSRRPLWRRLLRRPATAAVLEAAPCPVWTGTAESLGRPGSVRHVLCALALAPGNGRVLAWANAFAQRQGAALSIVHVDPTFQPMLLRGEACDWQRTEREWARQRLQSLSAETNAQGSVWLESGDPVETVAGVVRATGADLLVVGRSRAGVLPATAPKTWKFAQAMPCPVASC